MSSTSPATNGHAAPANAIVTTTILRSPVIRFILHAKIRNWSCNDVVFVGDRFIHVKQVKEQGHLEHIVTKNDFDAGVRAARTFTIQARNDEDESFIKKEGPALSATSSSIPPQCLVLTLDSNEIVFLYLTTESNGRLRFMQQNFLMPSFDKMLFQPGEHLAIDAYSRAIAVAANERELIIYAAKSPDHLQRELRKTEPDWVPVTAERPVQLDGVIQQMDFLIPSADDKDHVILLVLVMQDKRTRALWIDWHYATDIHHAQVHDGLPLEQPINAAGLLIPLRNAAFLLTNGDTITRFSDILSGSIRPRTVDIADRGILYPGASPRRPMWTNWCRPERGQSVVDRFYLAREDGAIFYVDAQDGLMNSCSAGDMDCNIGTAFASVGGLSDPDILVTAGDMSSGCVKEIGSRFAPGGIPEMSRSDTMDPQFVESIPNWASMTDMVASTLPGKSQRTRDGVFVTSGREPFGSVAELRFGREARLSSFVSLDEFPGIENVWALPLPGLGDLLVILSGPGTTSFLQSCENEDIEFAALQISGLESEHETILAALSPEGRILQVTPKKICTTTGLDASFEDREAVEMLAEDTILAAACDMHNALLVTAQRSMSESNRNILASYALTTDQEGRSSSTVLETLSSTTLKHEPLAIACVSQPSRTVALISTVSGQLEAFSVDVQGAFESIGRTQLPISESVPSTCDSIAILQMADLAHQDAQTTCMVLCGLRDGKIFSVHARVEEEISFGTGKVIEFGQSSVELVQPSEERSTCYAMSGVDTCILSWGGGESDSVQIQSIWISDKNRPGLPQPAISGCAHTPPRQFLGPTELGDLVIFVTKDELLLTDLVRQPSTVPRHMEVSGTPNRVLYLEEQRCLACASQKYGVRQFSSAPHERRQRWPVIDFIPAKSSEPSFNHEMQPGEQVYALLEWSFRQDGDKVYSFLLVGGSYVSSKSQSTRGRISFLQPTNKSWEIVDVKEGRPMRFESPVYALALLDPLTFVACTGYDVVVCRFSTSDRKWQAMCPGFTLRSAGTSISTCDNGAGTLITIATNADSIVVLRLEADEGAESSYEYKLEEHSTAPKAASSLHHLTLASSSPEPNMTLLTTKNGKLIGLQPPTAETHTTASRILFEATLPRSLTRLKQASIRPRWKLTRPAGVLTDNLIATSADGTLTGALLISVPLWRRLSWLQRLCEWSADLSPHSFQTPAYTVDTEMFARNERRMPIGFGAEAGEVVMRTERKKEQDGHVDGDVIARVLQRGGRACLEALVREAAEGDDAVGEWMTRHLDGELEAVENMVEILEGLVGGWL